MSKNKYSKQMRTCKRCKIAIHENSLYDYCPTCYKKIQDVFDKIREYLRKYPGATAYEMEQRLRIPVHIIKGFIKEGRLIEIPNEYLNVECLRCKCLLLSAHHKYCPSCEVEIYKEIEIAKQTLKQSPEKDDLKGKMHLRTYIKDNR
ncbi:MAG: hypothetical protein GX214_01690 [Clostridiales bacterium]|nr:hypothetical protein [Clostridiales bacterium]